MGRRLWLFFNEPRIVGKMMEASDLGKPSAGAIGQLLYDAFGDPVKVNRVKQFIGFLIRQVMEDNGYTHRAYGVKTPHDPVFHFASAYFKA